MKKLIKSRSRERGGSEGSLGPVTPPLHAGSCEGLDDTHLHLHGPPDGGSTGGSEGSGGSPSAMPRPPAETLSPQRSISEYELVGRTPAPAAARPRLLAPPPPRRSGSGGRKVLEMAGFCGPLFGSTPDAQGDGARPAPPRDRAAPPPRLLRAPRPPAWLRSLRHLATSPEE